MAAGGHDVPAQRGCRRGVCSKHGIKPIRMIRRPPMVAEHPLQKQIADALRLEIAPPSKVSRDGVVWWSVDHASYASAAPGARVGRGIVAGVPDLFVLPMALRTWSRS